MGRRITKKEYVGCLLQILQVITGIIAIIVLFSNVQEDKS